MILNRRLFYILLVELFLSILFYNIVIGGGINEFYRMQKQCIAHLISNFLVFFCLFYILSFLPIYMHNYSTYFCHYFCINWYSRNISYY